MAGIVKDVKTIAGIAPQFDDTDKLAVSLYRQNSAAGDEAVKNNTEVTVLTSASRTETTDSDDQTNTNARGAVIYMNVSGVELATDNIGFDVQMKDPVSGSYVTLIEGGTIHAAAMQTYVVYPGIADTQASQTLVQATPLPRTWRVRAVHVGAGEFKYSIGAQYIL